jgi:anti-sigma28 factor (negative regulator of flagellin synthesis)
MQVSGVDFVDVDIFDSISESEAKAITAASPNQTTLNSKLEDIANGVYTSAKLEKQKQPRPNISVNLARIEQGKQGIQPAQLAIFSPEIADSLILKEWRV